MFAPKGAPWLMLNNAGWYWFDLIAFDCLVFRSIPWNNNNPWCGGDHLRFLDPPRKFLTGLLSMPGSGNTYLRYLIQMATGVLTGSVYYQGWSDAVRGDSRLNTGFPAEGVVNGSGNIIQVMQGYISSIFPFFSVLTVKSHLLHALDSPTEEIQKLFKEVIVIIRWDYFEIGPGRAKRLLSFLQTTNIKILR